MKKFLVFAVCALALAILTSTTAQARDDGFVPQFLRPFICPGIGALAYGAAWAQCEGWTQPTRPMEAVSCEEQAQNAGNKALADCWGFGQIPLMFAENENSTYSEDPPEMLARGNASGYIRSLRHPLNC
ncbi:MAG: hypothetical protein A4E65_00166 [Syntrophorhabdus sp. PtaU1.Bin153]|nr:MAG: hypothetical protein A4E65_00166 [Syntrophorhabdus sp. PtaU1.Bin153]